MKLAARVHHLAESATLKVSRRASELRARGEEIIDFGAGEPDFGSPEVAVAAARQALAEGFTKYTPAVGIPDLRQAIARRYQRDYRAPWSAADVVVTVGAKGALFELALALFEHGSEVILPSPYWVSFPEQVRLAGADPVLVPMRRQDGFAIRAEPLLAACNGRTAAILVNSPCNPTGGMIEARDLERLALAARDRGFLLICDETYERFVYDGRRFDSAATLAARYPEAVVVVGSFSKTYAMTGWRLGYLLGPPMVVAAVARIQGHATSNPTSFAMPGALAALEGAEAEVGQMLDEYAHRRRILMDRLEAIPGFDCRPPAGAFYAFPDVSTLYDGAVSGSVAMAQMLLEEAGVAVVPGAAFGDDRHLRISFACSRENLETGLGRVEAAVRRLVGG